MHACWRGLGCGVRVSGYVTWVVESVCARRMLLNCCSHWPIVRAAQFVFVCGCLVGVRGEGGGRLKAVGFFAAAALGKGRHWAPVLVHCCSHYRRGEVGHDTGVFNTHVCNRVGGVVVVVVGGSI